jgi:transposase
MPSTIAQSVGVDIAKDTLEVHLHPAGKVSRFANDAKGCAALIAWLKGFEVVRVAFEPTGAYHRAFERRLAEAGLPLVKVNPRQARRFAEAIGRHAKLVLGPASGRTRGTDAVDAAMLARFAALLEPPVRPVVSATLDAMKALQVARRALVKDRVAARNRDHRHRSALLKRHARERLRQIDRQLAAIDAALHAELAADHALQARFAILVSIPGVGEATAFAMLIEMPELGALEPKAAASLAGLAPIARDSGQRSGKRCIRGGRAHLRQALYMPALVANRFNAAKGQVRRLTRRRQTAQAGAHRDHAQADNPRQCPHPRRPHMVAITRLTKHGYSRERRGWRRRCSSRSATARPR